ncbi:hypothetical protein ACSBR2_013009 [Camellia fascicularis]
MMTTRPSEKNQIRMVVRNLHGKLLQKMIVLPLFTFTELHEIGMQKMIVFIDATTSWIATAELDHKDLVRRGLLLYLETYGYVPGGVSVADCVYGHPLLVTVGDRHAHIHLYLFGRYDSLKTFR